MGVFSDDPALDAAMFWDFTSGSSGGSHGSGSNGGCGGCLGILIIIGVISLAVSKCTSRCSHDKTDTKYETVDNDSIEVADDTLLYDVGYDTSTEADDSFQSSPSTYHNTGTSLYSEDYEDGDDYDEDGYDSEGYDRHGYDRNGYDRDGYDEEGYDEEGIDEDGYDEDGKYTNDW